MARIRSIKPEFWTDRNVIQLSPFARLLFIGSWNFALCDRGHLPDDPIELKLKVLPADDVNPQALVDELLKLGRYVREETPDGRRFLRIVRLPDHQKVDSRWSPRCPACVAAPEHTEPPRDSPKLPETHPNSAKEGKGGEGKGGEGSRTEPACGKPDAPPRLMPVPPSKCERHANDPAPPPCGRCADARKAYEAWQRSRVGQHPSTRSVAEALAAARGDP